jgi:hypothetical protein
MDITEVADRLAIAETLALYCRGIDRCDGALLSAVFTPDARIDYGDGEKSPAETIPGLVAALGAMRLTQHNISNTVMRLSGDTAKAERTASRCTSSRPPKARSKWSSADAISTGW